MLTKFKDHPIESTVLATAMAVTAVALSFCSEPKSVEKEKQLLSSAASVYSQAKELDKKLSSTEAAISSGYAVAVKQKAVYFKTLEKVKPDETLKDSGSHHIGDSLDKVFFTELPELLSK